MSEKVVLPERLEETLEALLAVPSAPYAEGWLAGAIQARLAAWPQVQARRDRFGNLLFSYRPEGSGPARLAFQAHLDHPGFVLVEPAAGGAALAETRGGMPRNLRGASLRFFRAAGDPGVPARVVRSRRRGQERRLVLELAGRVELPAGTMGMYDLPACRRAGDYLEGRAFDDCLAAALLVHLVEEAARARRPTPFDVLLTRAEEVGFIGAVSLLADRSFDLPRHLVTVEMPRARGDVAAGDGVIVRTGDRLTNYDSDLVLWFQELAGQLARQDRSFRFQRRLAFTGGTEATAFLLYGYRPASLCLPVVNAHNIGPGNRPAPEKVHLADLASLARLLAAALEAPFRPAGPRRRLKAHLARLAAEQSPRLLGLS